MRVSSKGEVTIPKWVRDQAGMPPGTDVAFHFDGNVTTVAPAPPRAKPGMTRGERMVEALRGRATGWGDMSTDEIMKLLRGDD